MNKLEYPITYMNKDYYTIEEVLRDSYEVYKHNNDCKKQIGKYRGYIVHLDLTNACDNYSIYGYVKYQLHVADECNC